MGKEKKIFIITIQIINEEIIRSSFHLNRKRIIHIHNENNKVNEREREKNCQIMEFLFE